jgi:two-component system, NtrC family, sensor histidine kinase HydH
MRKIDFPVFFKKSLPLVYTSAFLLTLLIGFIGYSTSKKIQRVMINQFNQQQLILARKISDLIQNQMAYLETTLLELKKIGESKNLQVLIRTDGLLSQYRNLLSGDVLAILIVDWDGKPLAQNRLPGWNPRQIPLPSPSSFSMYQETRSFSNRIWVGNTFFLEDKWVLPIGVPLERKEFGQDRIGGAIFFILDAIHMAQKATQGVVSGKTGYAWIINRKGIFLDHYEKDFIGQSIFLVRKAKFPQMSFKKIDDLTRDKLLQKKEGTSTYVSGWHRSRRARTEKLIAFTPIPFYETPDGSRHQTPIKASEFWSVAVVAPTAEISGLVWSLNFQQILLIVIFQFCIILGTGLWVVISNRWSHYLTIEIEKKTRQLKRSHEKLIQTERLAAVGSMASHVSHEIKNPLIAIGGMAHQLKRSPLLGEKEKEKLELITAEINRLEKLLLEVRDFTRPITPQKVKAQINTILDDIIGLFGPVLTEQHIQVKRSLNTNLPNGFFDPGQIKQVFLNLIKNAVEAMPEGGTLTLQTDLTQQGILIKISDTGSGIDPQIREQLFRPFVSSKKKGTGLGLAVSYKLVQDHNGDIQVDSSGQGTTMTVILPLEES